MGIIYLKQGALKYIQVIHNFSAYWQVLFIFSHRCTD